MSGRILPGLATPGNATAYGPGSRTIPDVTMGSLASGFDEEAAEDEQLRRQNGGTCGLAVVLRFAEVSSPWLVFPVSYR